MVVGERHRILHRAGTAMQGAQWKLRERIDGFRPRQPPGARAQVGTTSRRREVSEKAPAPACHSKHNPIWGFPHVHCAAVNNRSRDNCCDCFSPRFHHPSGRASFEADARRQAASLAAIQAETSSASLMASPQHALLNSAPAALPWSFNEWIMVNIGGRCFPNLCH